MMKSNRVACWNVSEEALLNGAIKESLPEEVALLQSPSFNSLPHC